MKKEIYQLTYETEEQHWWYAARRQIIVSQLAHWIERLPGTTSGETTPTLLDYGCGTGLNLLHFKKHLDAYGVDAMPEAIEYCKKRGIDTATLLDDSDGVPETNPFNRTFDFISLLDVLEHIDDDVGALRRIGAWLEPGGQLLITVPAFNCLWSGEDYVSNHKRRYSAKNLNDTVRRAGFDIVKLSYFNFFLFPLQASVILTKRLLSKRSMETTNISRLPAPLNAFLRAIMASEAPLLKRGNLPIGGSILCWAKKGDEQV